MLVAGGAAEVNAALVGNKGQFTAVMLGGIDGLVLNADTGLGRGMAGTACHSADRRRPGTWPGQQDGRGNLDREGRLAGQPEGRIGSLRLGAC